MVVAAASRVRDGLFFKRHHPVVEMSFPDGIAAQDLGDVEEFYVRRLPVALSLAIRRIADRLDAESSASYSPAAEQMRRAERAALKGEFRPARDYYGAALAHLWVWEGCSARQA